MWNQNWFTEQDYDNDELDRFPLDAGYPGNKADWGWIQHISASLNQSGKAAIVMGTGSASRGSGENKNNQEKTVRRYFIERDLIEAVILLPFNLFYNTDAPGLIYVINNSKPPERSEKVLFINGSHGFVRGKPKNIFAREWLNLIPKLYKEFTEQEGVSRIVDITEIREKDYHLRPSRYVFEVVKPNADSISEVRSSYFKSQKKATSLAEQLCIQLAGIGRPGDKSFDTEFGHIMSECRLFRLRDLVREYSSRAGDEKYPVFSVSKVFGVVLQNEKFGHTKVASANKENYKVVKPSMFAYDPMLLWDGSIGLNRYPYAGVVSPAYTVFELVSAEVEPDYLELVLRSKIMIPFYISVSDGTNMRRRKAKFSDFCEIRIPLLPPNYQSVISASLRLQSSLERLLDETRGAAQSVLSSGMFGEED